MGLLKNEYLDNSKTKKKIMDFKLVPGLAAAITPEISFWMKSATLPNKLFIFRMIFLKLSPTIFFKLIVHDNYPKVLFKPFYR